MDLLSPQFELTYCGKLIEFYKLPFKVWTMNIYLVTMIDDVEQEITSYLNPFSLIALKSC